MTNAMSTVRISSAALNSGTRLLDEFSWFVELFHVYQDRIVFLFITLFSKIFNGICPLNKFLKTKNVKNRTILMPTLY